MTMKKKDECDMLLWAGMGMEFTVCVFGLALFVLSPLLQGVVHVLLSMMLAMASGMLLLAQTDDSEAWHVGRHGHGCGICLIVTVGLLFVALLVWRANMCAATVLATDATPVGTTEGLVAYGLGLAAMAVQALVARLVARHEEQDAVASMCHLDNRLYRRALAMYEDSRRVDLFVSSDLMAELQDICTLCSWMDDRLSHHLGQGPAAERVSSLMTAALEQVFDNCERIKALARLSGGSGDDSGRETFRKATAGLVARNRTIIDACQRMATRFETVPIGKDADVSEDLAKELDDLARALVPGDGAVTDGSMTLPGDGMGDDEGDVS